MKPRLHTLICSTRPGRVGPAHASQEGANVFPCTVAEDLDGQPDPAVIVFFQFRLQFSHVVCKPRDAEQARLRIEQRVHFWR